MLAATHLELAIFEGRGKFSRNVVDVPLALEPGLGEEELPLLVLERQGAGAAGEAGGVEPLVTEQKTLRHHLAAHRTPAFSIDSIFSDNGHGPTKHSHERTKSE